MTVTSDLYFEIQAAIRKATERDQYAQYAQEAAEEYDDGLVTARVVTYEQIARERAENPVCPTCKGPNTVWGIATAYFPHCSPWCQEGSRS